MKQGDEGVVVYGSRPLDAWHQSGDTQQPIDDRMHHLADAIHIPGVRSTPRQLQQVSNEAHHVRSDDKKHVSEVHPQSGISHTSVDASTAPASASFDPLTMATKLYRHIVQAAQGVIGSATDGGTTHDHGVTHSDGAFMRAANALHSVLAHPSDGASMNAENLLHQVLAHPTQGAVLSAEHGAHTVTASPSGVMLSSSSGIGFSAPSMSFPSGAISGAIGDLTGDLSGTLDDPQVVGLSNVDAHTLPSASSDAAAASAGVAVGGLYRNTAISTGVSVLCVRMA